MTDAEVSAKFGVYAGSRMSAGKSAELEGVIDGIVDAADLSAMEASIY